MQISQQQNIEPNNSPQLIDLIRDNIEYQQNQNIKSVLYKESLVKISLDKDFQHLFDQKNVQPICEHNSNTQHFVEVSNQVKDVCNWLEQSDQFKGMAYLQYQSLTKLMHILHQKVEGTVIVVTGYHSVWIQKMQQMAKLYKIKWAFYNSQLQKQDKVKILELYQMKKIKLFFISPSVFKYEQYLEFHADLLVIPDLHLYLKIAQFFNKIAEKCNPGRVLALYSTLMKQTYLNSDLNLSPINTPNSQTSIFISLKTQYDQKFKTLLTYLQKSTPKRTLVLVRDKAQSISLSKQLKLKSLTSFNLLEHLPTSSQLQQLQPPYLHSPPSAILQQKILETVYRSRNYQITISKYFDALRFGGYQCIVFYNFVDVAQFVEGCPDILHRVILLCQQDYWRYRNEITSEIITMQMLIKCVTKILQKTRKKQNSHSRRFYAQCVDDRLLDVYSVSKNYVEKNQEKVIRINWFCKNYDFTHQVFQKVVDALYKTDTLVKDCKLVYEIQIQEESLSKFRKLYPQALQIRRRINLLNLSTCCQKTTKLLQQQLKKQQIGYKITQKALQLKIIKNYQQVQWSELQKVINASIMQQIMYLDKSYSMFRQCSYGSIELTRRQKHLQRKKDILNFYHFTDEKHNNVLESSHRSNLLTSEIQEWIRNSNQNMLDEHDLILLLQGVQNSKTIKSKQDPIFGRYRRFKYEDLSQVVQRIYKNKRIKR